MTTFKAIHLVKRPSPGPVSSDIFEIVEKDLPTVNDGEILIKQTQMSLDPAMFGWMNADKKSYIPPVELNTVMRSSGVGEVVASQHSDFAVGDRVMGMMGWQEYCLSNGQGINKVQADVSDEMVLSVFALPGLTATQGLFNVGKPKSGETLVVTGAAGSVGSIVGQLAKADGLKVIGVVGSSEKANWIVDELGFDGAINYKTDDLEGKLNELVPEGIDLYFENTGGPIQHHVMQHMNAHGRIVVCGMIADYDKAEPAPGPSWVPIIKKRLRIEGFTMPDHFDKVPALLQKLTPYVTSGKINYRAHTLTGLESAIEGLNLFLTGENRGKLIVKL